MAHLLFTETLMLLLYGAYDRTFVFAGRMTLEVEYWYWRRNFERYTLSNKRNL